jgi:hypothetical protein
MRFRVPETPKPVVGSRYSRPAASLRTIESEGRAPVPKKARSPGTRATSTSTSSTSFVGFPGIGTSARRGRLSPSGASMAGSGRLARSPRKLTAPAVRSASIPSSVAGPEESERFS